MNLKLKICGMKEPENILEVAALRPDFMGFIFYPTSPRYVGKEFIMPDIDPEIAKVGVFVNEPVEFIVDKAIQCGLNYIQLHGDESPEYCAELSQHIPIIKAFGVDENFDFGTLAAYEPYCAYFLFDTKSETRGGSGKKFDWDVLRNYNGGLPFFLSGGIGIEEVSDVRGQVSDGKMFGVDVNSRFEVTPGIKDVEKLKQITAKTLRR